MQVSGRMRRNPKSGASLWERKMVQLLQKMICMPVCSVVSDSVTPWTAAHQAPLSMGLSRQDYWSGLTFPTPGDLSNPGIKPRSFASPALADGFFTTWEAPMENDMAIPQIIQHRIIIWSNSSTLGIIAQRNESRDQNSYLNTYLHSSVIHSSQNVEASHVPISRWQETTCRTYIRWGIILWIRIRDSNKSCCGHRFWVLFLQYQQGCAWITG